MIYLLVYGLYKSVIFLWAFLETSQRTTGRFARWVCGVFLSFCLFLLLLDVDLICVNC